MNDQIEKKNRRIEMLITGLVFLLLALLISMRCSLNPYHPIRPFTDSSVYLYIAQIMRHGGVPYKDVFDHKGPLLYLVNYIGLLTGSEYGVWLLEIFSFLLTALFSYKVMRLFCPILESIFGAIISLLLLNTFFYGGNNPEEYALPFITGAILVYVKYFVENEASRRNLFLCGLCWMGVMLIRPNMISAWVVFSFMVLFKELRKKSKEIWPYLLWFVFGALSLLLPFIIYLSVNTALPDFWYDYIIFNFTYTAAESSGQMAMILHYLQQPPVIISFVLSVLTLVQSKNMRELAIGEIAFIVVTVCLTGMSGRGYAHYGITLMPMYILPIAFFIQAINRKYASKHVVAIGLSMITIVLLAPWVKYIIELPTYRPAQYSAERILSQIIADNTDPEDKIISCGNANLFYVYSDRLAASKYSYQLPIAEADHRIYDEFIREISEKKPTVIVTSKDTVNGILYLDEINKRMDEFIKEYEYKEWLSAEGFSVFGLTEIDLNSVLGEQP